MSIWSAPGTQWERGDDFDHEQFPPESEYVRYEVLAERKYPRVGDISARSALTIHRGTPNRSEIPRPVLDELPPITQKHDIEGLVMG